jgi:hypothetical protein
VTKANLLGSRTPDCRHDPSHGSNAQRQLYSSAYHRYRDVYYVLKPVFEKVET